MQVITIIAIIIGSYLIGSINFSILISKSISGKDIRESGSGNAGATNMLRTYGKKMAVITLLLDVLKGVICVLAAVLYVRYINSPYINYNPAYREMISGMSLPYIAGVCVILGHDFPLFFEFKGGKGVATSLGVVLMLDWKIGLLLAVCAITVMAVTRYVSLGSVLGGIAFIVGETVKMISDHDFNIVQFICILILGGLLVAKHKANIKRLLNGTENKLGVKSK